MGVSRLPSKPLPPHLRPSLASQLPGLWSQGLLAGLSFSVGSSFGAPIAGGPGWGDLQAALLPFKVGLEALGASYLLLCTALYSSISAPIPDPRHCTRGHPRSELAPRPSRHASGPWGCLVPALARPDSASGGYGT
jgi:hypothetical protein